MKISFLLPTLITICSITARGQTTTSSTFNATGGSSTISGHTYEFSIGEMSLVNTFSSTGIIVTQGILQPAAQTSSIDEKNFLINNLNIYPNPANEILFIQPKFHIGGDLTYNLHDGLGRIILSGKFKLAIGNERQFISLKNIAASTYTLSMNFENSGQNFKGAYKIQKLQ